MSVTSEAEFPRAPLPISAARADFFPSTHLTQLLGELRTSYADDPRRNLSDAHRRLAEQVMARYAAPLEAYARGSPLRDIAEPAELVHGYFATALSDPTYFARYQSSGMRLRRWMMNGLLLHARGVVRDRGRKIRREGASIDLVATPHAVDASAEQAFDRAWALALLSEACAGVEGALLAEGRDRAWTVFKRHAIDGRSYIELESELGLGRQQMADLVRGVTRRVRARILELLESEGGDAAEELRDVIRLVS